MSTILPERMVERTVTTTGGGSRQHPVERAHVQLEVKGEGASPGVARQEASDTGATVLTSLPDDLGRTTGIRIDEGTFPDDDEEYPFTARQTIEVTAMPDEAASVVIAATDAGASVSSVQFDLTDETRKRLYDEAVVEAATAARRTASQIASAEDATVGPVRDVRTVDPTGMASVIDSALEAGPNNAFEFHPGPVTVEAQVEMTFDLFADS